MSPSTGTIAARCVAAERGLSELTHRRGLSSNHIAFVRNLWARPAGKVCLSVQTQPLTETPMKRCCALAEVLDTYRSMDDFAKIRMLGYETVPGPGEDGS